LPTAYRRQVALLIRTLPSVAAEECFAMKGGTAINLFVRDLPRLSVDIDLTYLPIQDRAASLAAIDAAMLRIADRIADAVRGARVAPSRSRENVVTKLVLRSAAMVRRSRSRLRLSCEAACSSPRFVRYR
jgi:Nucleotidyl transferase AbiEii toxin, Type IV TA system